MFMRDSQTKTKSQTYSHGTLYGTTQYMDRMWRSYDKDNLSGRPKNRGHFVLQLITSEMLNRSLTLFILSTLMIMMTVS